MKFTLYMTNFQALSIMTQDFLNFDIFQVCSGHATGSDRVHISDF